MPREPVRAPQCPRCKTRIDAVFSKKGQTVACSCGMRFTATEILAVPVLMASDSEPILPVEDLPIPLPNKAPPEDLTAALLPIFVLMRTMGQAYIRTNSRDRRDTKPVVSSKTIERYMKRAWETLRWIDPRLTQGMVRLDERRLEHLVRNILEKLSKNTT